MKVLSITGDRRFGPGNPRFELQRAAVDELVALYWGRGAWWPRLPLASFDVVTVQDPLLRGLFACYAAKKIGARLNVQVHLDLAIQPLAKRILARIVLRCADSVRAVSERIKRQVEAAGARAPISVLPVFVDVERFRGIERRPHAAKIILWVGRFEAEKDPGAAVAALREIRSSGIDATLVMLGSGSLLPKLRKRAESLPVEFPGWQDPLPYLAEADVVLSTSRHESWGASIVEALAAGVPVVAPDVGVAREAGAIIATRSELAQAVAQVLQSTTKGELRIALCNKENWAEAWKRTL